jgi:hypothetical protein
MEQPLALDNYAYDAPAVLYYSAKPEMFDIIFRNQTTGAVVEELKPQVYWLNHQTTEYRTTRDREWSNKPSKLTKTSFAGLSSV